MSAKGGYFITFEPARRELLKEVAEYQDRFTVELSASDWPAVTKELFLCSFFQNIQLIEAVCMSRRKKGPRNTGGYNIEFSNFVFFEPLNLDSLLSQISNSGRATIKDREENRGKWFPPSVWQELFQLIKKTRPTAAAALD